MKALTSPDVRALHGIALGDRRLDKASRVILAEVARTGHDRNTQHLATIAGLKNPAPAAARLAKLREYGYLPGADRPVSKAAGL